MVWQQEQSKVEESERYYMLERLRVAESGRYIETVSGKPFLYLADTAWTIGNKLLPEEIEYYLDNRKAKGFTVIQMVLFNPETEESIHTAEGEEAFYENDPLKWNPEYISYIDKIIALADEKGLYVTLLPVWGQLVTGDNWEGSSFVKLIRQDNAYEFGIMVGIHYREMTNLIWCLGGDRHPVHLGQDYRMVWRKMAEGLVHGLTRKEVRWNILSEAWKQVILTYHPTISDDPPGFSSSLYFADDSWLSMHMLQSGHREHVRSYDQIYHDYQRHPHKPVLDGEPNYEDWYYENAVGWRCHDEWNVRKRAYWALFGGACGHTYGHACVWRMVRAGEQDEYLRYCWREALERPGAVQMSYIRRLVESIDFFHSHPCQEMLSIRDNYLDVRRQCRLADDGSFAVVYFTCGGQEMIDLTYLNEGDKEHYWFDPREGKYYSSGYQYQVHDSVAANKEKYCFSSPSRGECHDWVLIIRGVGCSSHI